MSSSIVPYLGSFLEGLLAFVAPCMLPMLPIYVTYFAGGEEEESSLTTLKNALGFVVGFTLVYVLLGATAGALGSFLLRYKTATNIIFGAIVVLFGLHYIGIIQIGFLNKLTGPQVDSDKLQNLSFFSSVVFGIIFATTSTACQTIFVGSALVDASLKGNALQGALSLFVFSLGIAIPLILSALLINQLKNVFDFLKRNYRIINIISGALLVIIGVAMMTGLLDKGLMMMSGGR